MNLKKHITIIALTALGCLGFVNAAPNIGSIAAIENVVPVNVEEIANSDIVVNIAIINIGDIAAIKNIVPINSDSNVVFDLTAIKAIDNSTIAMNTALPINIVDIPLGIGDNIVNIATSNYSTGNIVNFPAGVGKMMLC